MDKYILIYSGGMDSTVLLNEFKESIGLAISFDYGSKHNQREIGFAIENCRELRIPHKVVNLREVMKDFNSSLIQDDQEVPEGHYESETMKSTVVPFRNGIMLSIAIGFAESYKFAGVLIANHAGDHAVYPDCRTTFINAINKAATLGTYEEIKVISPYSKIDKTAIAANGYFLNVDFTKTWSCYKGEEVHCGRCGTCVERREALGINDKTNYQNQL